MFFMLTGVYYCFNIAVVIFSIFLSSIVSKVESCQDVVKLKRVPVLARKVCSEISYHRAPNFDLTVQGPT